MAKAIAAAHAPRGQVGDAPVPASQLAEWEAALAAMHVRRPDGTLVQGARAFGDLWAALPAFRPLAWAMRLPGAGWLADLGYAGFLRARRLWR
jgi:hypothetical protein